MPNDDLEATKKRLARLEYFFGELIKKTFAYCSTILHLRLIVVGLAIVFALGLQERISSAEDLPPSLADSDIAAFIDPFTGESRIGKLTFNGASFDHISNRVIEPKTYVPTRLQAILSQQNSYVKYVNEGALVWENGIIENRDTIQILGCSATLQDAKRLGLTAQAEDEIVNYWSGIVNTVHSPRIRRKLGRKAKTLQEPLPLQMIILEGQKFKAGETISLKAVLMNVGPQSITLVQPALDWTLAIRYGRVGEDLETLGMKALVSRIPPATSRIRPGKEIVFTTIIPSGLYGLPSKPGDYQFQMIYTRSKEDFFGKEVWTGEISSLPVGVRLLERGPG